MKSSLQVSELGDLLLYLLIMQCACVLLESNLLPMLSDLCHVKCPGQELAGYDILTRYDLSCLWHQ